MSCKPSTSKILVAIILARPPRGYTLVSILVSVFIAVLFVILVLSVSDVFHIRLF